MFKNKKKCNKYKSFGNSDKLLLLMRVKEVGEEEVQITINIQKLLVRDTSWAILASRALE